MNCLFFIHSLAAGGAERATVNLANYWASKGWKITIVTVVQIPDFYALDPRITRVHINIPLEHPNKILAIFHHIRRVHHLRMLIKQIQPQVAIGVMTYSAILLSLANFTKSHTLFIGIEQIHPPKYPLSRPWEILRKYLYKRLHAVVVLTAETASWINAHTRARKVAVIPNPVVYPLETHTPFLPVEPYVAPHQKLLLAVGRLTDQKGFDLLIPVFAKLANSFPEWKLIILGEGELREVLENQIQQWQLTDKILLPGKAGNLPDWYSRADLFVMTSRFEGFPNALIEALAYGVPAVSFDCDTGPRDIIRHEVDGLLVPDQDSTALQKALQKLMLDDDLRARYAARAVEVRERFSIEKISSMWETLYAELR